LSLASEMMEMCSRGSGRLPSMCKRIMTRLHLLRMKPRTARTVLEALPASSQGLRSSRIHGSPWPGGLGGGGGGGGEEQAEEALLSESLLSTISRRPTGGRR
jgi:hypothetical protein